MSHTLVSFLALRMAQPENVATDALGFILKESPDARRALARLCAQAGVELPEGTTYRTQVRNAGGGRPDLVGHAADGAEPLVVEAKFWAGLTDAQPVDYLNEMMPGALLLFIAPARRLEILWDEVAKRCERGGLSVGAVISSGPEIRSASIGVQRVALVSWRFLLQGMSSLIEAAGDAARAEDVRQLMGLCERMDEEAFLPLTNEELSASTGQRIIEFGQLADDLALRLAADGHASTKGLRPASGNGRHGRYIHIHGCGALLGFSAWAWKSKGLSPIWLGVKGPDWKPSLAVRNALTKASIRFFHHDEHGSEVPIMLLSGRERDEVFADAYRQLVAATQALSGVTQGAPAVGAPPPVPGEDAEE